MKMDIKKKLTIAQQDIDELLANTTFVNGVKTIRKQYMIPAKGFSDINKFKKWRDFLLKDEDQLNNYIKDIKHLQRKAKLTDRWFDFVRDFVETNKVTYQTFSKFKIHLVNKESKPNLEAGLYLRIYPDTRERDIRESWKFIEIWQKRLEGYSKRKRVKPKHSRNLKLHKAFHKKKMKIWEIAEYVYEGEDDKKAMKAVGVAKKALSRKRQQIKQSR